MLSDYTIGVRLPGGSVTSVVIRAISAGAALDQCRALYGFSGVLGILESHFVR